MNPTIYERMVAAGVPTDSHESDLYVPASQTALAVLAQYRAECVALGVPPPHTSRFPCTTDGGNPWLDISFCFDPFWTAKAAKP